MVADTPHTTRDDEQTDQPTAQDETHPHAGGEAQTLVAKGPDVPMAAEGVRATEGTAASEQEQGQVEGGRVRALLFAPDVEPRDVPLAEVPERTREDRNFVWVDLVGYAHHDLEQVARLLRLPPTAVRTALAEWKRPRMQVFGDQLYVTATVPQIDPDAFRVEAQQLDLFLGPNFLVSAHKRAVPFDERILARARQNPTLLDQDAIFLLHLFLDELVGYYEQIHEQVENHIEQMEERALTDTSDTFLHDLVRFKRYAFALSQLADQHRPIFDAFRTSGPLRDPIRKRSSSMPMPTMRDLARGRRGRTPSGRTPTCSRTGSSHL